MDHRLRCKTKIHNARVKCAIEYYVAAMQRFAYVVSHVPTYLHPPTRHSWTLTFYVSRIVRRRWKNSVCEKNFRIEYAFLWIFLLLFINNFAHYVDLRTTGTHISPYLYIFLHNFLLRRSKIFADVEDVRKIKFRSLKLRNQIFESYLSLSNNYMIQIYRHHSCNWQRIEGIHFCQN